MGYLQSDLSANNINNGYDAVMTICESSINTSVSEYLVENGSSVQFTMYFSGGPDYSYISSAPQGVDPFSMATQTYGPFPNAISSDIQALLDAQFYYAIRATPGLPQVSPYPNLVFLNQSTAGTVTSCDFNVTFSQFEIVMLTPDVNGDGGGNFINISQADGDAWIWAISNLPMTVAHTSNYPQIVSEQLSNLGGGQVFKVSFDFTWQFLENNAFSEPTIPGFTLPTGFTANMLQQYSMGMLTNDFTPPIAFCLLPTTPGLFTLNYVPFLWNDLYNPPGGESFSADLNTMSIIGAVYNSYPPYAAVGFSWNWMDAGDNVSFDGVAAVNRNALGDFFQGQLAGFVASNCYQPTVDMSSETVTMAPGSYAFSYPSGNQLLILNYQSNPASGSSGTKHASVNCTYTLVLNPGSGGNNLLTSAQQLVVTITAESGSISIPVTNIVDVSREDTFGFTTGEGGAITITSIGSPVITDNSQAVPQENGFGDFFNHLNELTGSIKTSVNNIVTPGGLSALPLTALQSMVIPGAAPFNFANACFSDNGDMVAQVTYS